MKINMYESLFKLNSKVRCNLMRFIYPETEKIFNDSDFSFPFEAADMAHVGQKKLSKHYKKNLIDIEAIYQEFLYELGCLICDIKKDPNVHEIMYIFGYLLYNGYLSKGNNFNFLVPQRELIARPGVNVMYGTGVCRNIGAMFADLLDTFEVENYAVMTDKETFEYEIPIYIDEFFDFFKEDPLYTLLATEERNKKIEEDPNFSPKRGNHLEVIVHTKTWDLFDPSNLCAYSISSKFNTYQVLKYIRFWSLYALGNCSLRDTINLYNLLKNKYLRLHKSEEIFDIQQECFDRCEGNKSKILKFNESVSPHLSYIDDVFRKKK